MHDIPELKIKYKISEDGKTVMLLSPNDSEAKSAKEGELQFGFNPQDISRGYPVWMDLVPGGNAPVGIEYLTIQVSVNKNAKNESISGFVNNVNRKGKYKDQRGFYKDQRGVFFAGGATPPEWRKVKHLRFANEKACDYVTDYLKSIDFNDHYKYILRRPDFMEGYPLLKKTQEGIKLESFSATPEKPALSKELFAEHAKVLSGIRDEFVELLEQDIAKKPVLKVQKRGELIKISQRNPESMQSVLTKLFYWIMDKLRGISDLKIETKIVEGEEKGTYQLKVMLSGRKAHEIESGIIDGEAQYLVHEAFNVDGKPEALRAFIDEVKKLNPEQQLETYNEELREMGITEQQQANLTVDLKDVYQDLSKKAQEALEKKCKKDVEPQNYKPSGGLLEKVSSKLEEAQKYAESIVEDIVKKG